MSFYLEQGLYWNKAGPVLTVCGTLKECETACSVDTSCIVFNYTTGGSCPSGKGTCQPLYITDLGLEGTSGGPKTSYILRTPPAKTTNHWYILLIAFLILMFLIK